MVQRYDPDIGMIFTDDGDYVEYEDYKKLVDAIESNQAFHTAIWNLDDEEALDWKENVMKENKQLKEAEKE